MNLMNIYLLQTFICIILCLSVIIFHLYEIFTTSTLFMLGTEVIVIGLIAICSIIFKDDLELHQEDYLMFHDIDMF